MKFLGAILCAILLQFVGCSENDYAVPEPLFQVFSPKGLRVSIPDCREIKSVEFSFNIPSLTEPLNEVVNETKGGFWVYWNPNVPLRLYDKIQYKLMIKYRDAYWKKEGSHIVHKVIPLAGFQNDTDCLENKNQKITAGYPDMDDVQERQMGTVRTGKSSNYKSSYSTYKSSDLKPITKSSTSTTSGTFYLKPSGVMEATGYKKESVFDSTKNEGEQWRHSVSELTAEELENMRQLYGGGLITFPQLSGKLFPGGAKIYEKNYMSSESQSFPSMLRTVGFDEAPMTSHQFHQTHKTHESSSVSHSKPVFQYYYTDSSGGEVSGGSNIHGEKVYRVESTDKLPNPLPPHGTMFRATEYVKEEHIPVGETQFHVSRESHTNLQPQKLVQASVSGESTTRNQEIVKPVYRGDLGSKKFVHETKTKEYFVNNQELKPTYPQVGAAGGEQTNQFEYNAGNLRMVDSRQDLKTRHYVGNIFSSVTTAKPKSPQECRLIPGVDYKSFESLKEVEKYVFELGCLADLAESSIKEEIALLKQKNAQMARKYESLEYEVKRLERSCNCYQ